MLVSCAWGTRRKAAPGRKRVQRLRVVHDPTEVVSGRQHRVDQALAVGGQRAGKSMGKLVADPIGDTLVPRLHPEPPMGSRFGPEKGGRGGDAESDWVGHQRAERHGQRSQRPQRRVDEQLCLHSGADARIGLERGNMSGRPDCRMVPHGGAGQCPEAAVPQIMRQGSNEIAAQVRGALLGRDLPDAHLAAQVRPPAPTDIGKIDWLSGRGAPSMHEHGARRAAALGLDVKQAGVERREGDGLLVPHGAYPEGLGGPHARQAGRIDGDEDIVSTEHGDTSMRRR